MPSMCCSSIYMVGSDFYLHGSSKIYFGLKVSLRYYQIPSGGIVSIDIYFSAKVRAYICV